MVERVTRHLAERIGEENVAAHHGSLAKEQRFDAEQRLKAGRLKAMVATASLELGIDIGDVELVCQLGSPRSISVFLQRVGRANHSVGGVPKGRLFPSSRDELIESVALLDAVRRGELDQLSIPAHPLDVLSQQIVAEVAAREYGEDELFSLVTRAWPYRELPRKDFDDVVRMLAEGISTRRGRRGAYLHRDAVNHRLRPRRGARLTAITCGGAIPDNADYQVILEPAGTFVGTLNEDFAVESLQGDIFQLGNASYRILRVEAGRVRVEDAKGQPPSIPFWLGEAPARTPELSAAVSRLRESVEALLPEVTGETVARAVDDTMQRFRIDRVAAQQLVEYLASAKAVLGRLPTIDTLVFERFFDESGGMQLVIHAPLGARINRAFGLALRKRFCRAFNFELQAAATEDAIVLSLGETHSFELDSVARFLNSASVEDVLVQAVLDAPLFTTRWRWNASISLAIRRNQGGKRTPAPLQRMAADDLIAVVFPQQLACAENLTGEREVPDHPLVKQTLADCLHEAMDVEGLVALLRSIERGETRVVARDLPAPSPLAAEILTARPYAYLDDAPLEERRTQAVASRRWLDPESAAEMGRLDPAAIAAVREEAWPEAGSADELHDALMSLGVVTGEEGVRSGWSTLLEALVAARRATRLYAAGREFWVAAETLPMLAAIHGDGRLDPAIDAPREHAARPWTREEAVVELMRLRLQGLGPVTVGPVAASLGLAPGEVETALAALESEGFVLRGQFTPPDGDRAGVPGDGRQEWCERRLLARIHRYTIRTLRAEIEPVSSADFMRFLLDWQGVTRDPRPEGIESLAALITQLEGYEIPASAWESDVLPARIHEYDPNWLDSSVPVGPRALGAAHAGQGDDGGPCAFDADHAPHTQELEPVAIAHRAAARRHAALASRAGAGGASPRSRRLFLRRHRERHGPAACAGRGGARRGCRGRTRQCRQLQRVASAPDSVRAQAAPGRKTAAHRTFRAGGRWPVEPHAPRSAARGHGVGRAGRDDSAAPLRRRVPSCPGARGGMAAALACAAARISPARGAGNDPRRALRGGHEWRAVRATRGGHGTARRAPARADRRPHRPLRRRSAQPDRHRDTRATRPCACRQPRAVPGRRAGRDPCRRSVRFPGGDGTRLGMGSPAGSAAQAPGSMAGTGTTGLTHSTRR